MNELQFPSRRAATCVIAGLIALLAVTIGPSWNRRPDGNTKPDPDKRTEPGWITDTHETIFGSVLAAVPDGEWWAVNDKLVVVMRLRDRSGHAAVYLRGEMHVYAARLEMPEAGCLVYEFVRNDRSSWWHAEIDLDFEIPPQDVGTERDVIRKINITRVVGEQWRGIQTFSVHFNRLAPAESLAPPADLPRIRELRGLLSGVGGERGSN